MRNSKNRMIAKTISIGNLLSFIEALTDEGDVIRHNRYSRNP